MSRFLGFLEGARPPKTEAERRRNHLFGKAHCDEYRRGITRAARTRGTGGAIDPFEVEGHLKGLTIDAGKCEVGGMGEAKCGASVDDEIGNVFAERSLELITNGCQSIFWTRCTQ